MVSTAELVLLAVELLVHPSAGQTLQALAVPAPIQLLESVTVGDLGTS